MKSYESALRAIRPKELSFGYSSIQILEPPFLPSAQVGFSIGPSGESLCGEEPGDWRKSWLVIGLEGLCGDPLFIDTSEEGCPVYTAIHGEGRWEPQRIAVSLSTFADAISALAAISVGREHPVALERNPLTQSERETTLATIRIQNPGIALSFWSLLLDNS